MSWNSAFVCWNDVSRHAEHDDMTELTNKDERRGVCDDRILDVVRASLLSTGVRSLALLLSPSG